MTPKSSTIFGIVHDIQTDVLLEILVTLLNEF